MTTTTQLIRQAEKLEDDARALRRAAALMNGHYTAKAATGLDRRLAKAAAMRDAESPQTTRAQRAQSWSDAVGAALDPAVIYTPQELRAAIRTAGAAVPSTGHLATMLRRHGWTASGRSSTAHWTHTGNGTAPTTRKTRQRRDQQNRKATARMLARLAKHDGPAPKSFVGRAAGPLLNAGYIKRSGDGYERTDKPFEVS